MKRIVPLLIGLLLVGAWHRVSAAEPLRIFLRGGPKTHGPAGNGLHDHTRWMEDWTLLLRERGARVTGALAFPTGDQLAQTDVLVMFAANAGNLDAAQRAGLDAFLKRGGGVVCLHDAVCGDDPQWFKTVTGGAWEHGHSKYYEGDVSIMYVNHEHPITQGASNFDIEDEVYWDLHLQPGATILAGSWRPDTRRAPGNRLQPHVYGVIPQMWTYEADGHRAFVSLLGHRYESFQKPHVRGAILRGIAWAGRRDVDALCSREELASFRYPEGGPTAPEKAGALLSLHPDFTLQLTAAEPLVNKVMAIDWDAAGRTWAAETIEYPNGRRGVRADDDQAWMDHGGIDNTPGLQQRPARDRISILTDRDGDGRLDKKQVFHEGLELVTSFVLHRDGVIASAAPNIYLLQDTDGDDQADKVEVLYTGLGTRDTHAVINSLRWGFDGWIYATHGYSAGQVTSPDGGQSFGTIGSGVVRFRPDGGAFEQVSSKGGNTWGLDIAWDNEIFFTQPTSGDLLNHVVLPESVLAMGRVGNTPSFKAMIRRRPSYPLLSYESLPYVQIDQVGYFTAAAGCAIYDGGTWPEDWNYGYFTTEPTINLIHHEAVQPDGVSFDAAKTRQEEFIGGRDPWFRPIETRIGPDGALYLVDFYNQAVIHNDTRGPAHNNVNAAVRPDRDHYFARIWRVDHRQARPVEVPNLEGASLNELAQALSHPNQHVRMTAFRLLLERNGADAAPAFKRLALSKDDPRAAVVGLWGLQRLHTLDDDTLVAALANEHAAVRKNALRVAQLAGAKGSALPQAVKNTLDDPDPQVRLSAVQALAGVGVDDATAQALLKSYPGLEDAWVRSATLALMSARPFEFLEAALQLPQTDALDEVVVHLGGQVAERQDAAGAARFVELVSQQPASANGLKAVALATLAQRLRADVVPAWDADLQSAFRGLLQSDDSRLPVTALPLLVRWDREKVLSGNLTEVIQGLLGRLQDPNQSSDQRVSLALSLVGVASVDDRILPAVGASLQSSPDEEYKAAVIAALGSLEGDESAQVLVVSYAGLSPSLQETALGELLKRPASTRRFLAAIQEGTVNHESLSPSTIYRLRHHSNPEVATAANTLFDTLRGPELKEKNALIDSMVAAVSQPGNPAHGRELFEQNCATCHQFAGMGREVGPGLNGMGAHGAGELLVHILDPNRAVEDTYLTTSIETEDDEIYDGIVARENRRTLFLRNASGEMEIAKNNIRSRRNTGRSLMPSGFEALGGEGLRDLLAFMTQTDSRFRVLDLSPAATADSRQGMYLAPDNLNDTFKFRRLGHVSVDGIPFSIADPTRAPGGRNLIVLKGGSSDSVHSKNFPQRVELPVGMEATKLHFLGGVGGWGFPWGGDALNGKPVMKVTAVFDDGRKEETVLKNGETFADWIREVDVPGSRRAEGVVTANQLRWFTLPLRQPGLVASLILESYDTDVAPTTVAITAERGGAGSTLEAPAAAAETAAQQGAADGGDPIKVLIVGGGDAHDFDRWFNKADVAILSADGFARATYTDDPAAIAPALKDTEVLVMTLNKPIPDPATREAIFKHVESGKGLVMVHAGLWYNWRDWPEYNKVLAGGGSRGHDRYGTFTVTLTEEKHPITTGVEASFTLDDELYYFQPDPEGTPIRVLATAHSERRNQAFPMVFVVQHPKSRVAGITLGHDGAAHDHKDFKLLLRNAVRWAAGK